VKGQLEGETTRVWDDILHNYFKSREGYSTGSELMIGRGFADIFTAHIVLGTRYNEKKFFIVECKAPGLETRDAVGKKHLPSCEYTFPPSTGTTESTGQLPLGKSFGSMNRQMMI
jgi:hypothetical protein